MPNAAITYHFKQNESLTSNDLICNLYIDNVVSGSHSEEAAVDYFIHSRSILSKANFNFRSWASNSKQLNNTAHLIDISGYSKLSKLLSVTAYVCHFTHNTRQPSSLQQVGPLTPSELSQANLMWIHNTQQTVFAKEIADIQSRHNC